MTNEMLSGVDWEKRGRVIRKGARAEYFLMDRGYTTRRALFREDQTIAIADLTEVHSRADSDMLLGDPSVPSKYADDFVPEI